jgi:ferrous iron transport protein B
MSVASLSTVNIALVGPPNSGKTTLFNWLTGRRQKVVNYPGSTVDITCGSVLDNLVSKEGEKVVGYQFIDTPGTYSLFPKSPDEEVTIKTLFDSAYKIEKVVLVLDSTQLDRQWHLLRQLQEANFNVIVAVTMHDLHANENSELDLKELARRAQAPVLPIDGTTGWGTPQLVSAVVKEPQRFTEPVKLIPWNYNKSQQIFAEGEQVTKAVAKKKLNVFLLTEARDRILLHPVAGIFIFAFIMFALFSSIYWAAAPLMDQVDGLFGFLNEQSKVLLGENLFGQLVSDGIINGLGWFLYRRFLFYSWVFRFLRIAGTSRERRR